MRKGIWVHWLITLIIFYSAAHSSPAIASRPVARTSGADGPADTWFWSPTETLADATAARYDHTAIWTGGSPGSGEMIIWGGFDDHRTINAGGRYNPSTNTWKPLSTINAPSARANHTAVWTGTEMIVWGGQGIGGPFDTGARYNPATDTWKPISTQYAPSGRSFHTAVWTGKEMIIWGGQKGFESLNSGGRYNPSTDTWTPISMTDAPSPRIYHTVVWTGGTTGMGEMIVWSGREFTDHGYVTGGRYNPVTDTWTAMSTTNAPSAREGHTAIWATGSSTNGEMIIWGGIGNYGDSVSFNNGARYDPIRDTWTMISNEGAPDPRAWHSVVWADARGEMIVWGGYDIYNGYFNTGGRYNWENDSWSSISTENAPNERRWHTAVWTNTGEMLVWGGKDANMAYNTGARYNPVTDDWMPITIPYFPEARVSHTAVWTGEEMVVWGGQGNNGSPGYLNTGGRYDLLTGIWTPTSLLNAPSPRRLHTAVWTGTEMIVWGGSSWDGPALNTGGRYNPKTDTWKPVSTTNAPEPRYFHTAVWTGTEMIVWGGYEQNLGASYKGGRYNPTTDTWTPISTQSVPLARLGHTAIWTGSEMIVWGGWDKYQRYLNTGGRYNPIDDTWRDISTNGVPEGETNHTAVWTGGTSHDGEMIIWGGQKWEWDTGQVETSACYNPATNTWRPISTTNAPLAAAGYTAVWTGTEMIIWGGNNSTDASFTNTGGSYNPKTDTWTPLRINGAPEPRGAHTAVWASGPNEMIIWGGQLSSSILLNTGSRYHIANQIFLPSIRR